MEKWLHSYFKIWPVVLPSWNVTVTRKRGLNLSNGSSPVLRPLWLAIQSICQAGGTLWLWGTGTGGDGWEISSAATPFPWSWLTLLATGSVSILASQLFRSSPCSPSPVRCVIPELSFYKEKKQRKKRKKFHYSIWIREFRRHGMIAQTPQTAVVEVKKGKTWKSSYFKCIQIWCPTHRPLAWFCLLSSFTGNIDLLFTQRRETKMIFCFAVDKLFWKKILIKCCSRREAHQTLKCYASH